MNKASKAFACFAVFVMLAASCVCIANVSNSDGSSNAIDSTETVVLYTDKSYEDNKENLAKLGLGSNSWSWNEERGSYRLLLKDVVFRTTANVALVLATDTTDANPKFAIKLEGENTLTAGSEQKCEFIDQSIALYALHYQRSEGKIVPYEDFTLTIVGDGTLVASSNVIGYRTNASCGISVGGTLAIRGQPSIFAVSDDVTFNAEPSDFSQMSISVGSMGIQATKMVTSYSGSMYGPNIHAASGDVNVSFMKSDSTYNGAVFMFSSGIFCGSYDLKNATIACIGGNVDYANIYGNFGEESTLMFAMSSGLGSYGLANDKYYEYSISDCHIVASSGNAVSASNAISAPVSFGKSTETTVIKDSIIKAEAGNAISVFGITYFSPTIPFASSSNGLYCGSDLDVKNSLLSLSTGETSTSRNSFELRKYSSGLYATGNISIQGSIVKAISQDIHCYKGCGINVGPESSAKALAITDSEVIAAGKQNAIKASSVTVNGTPRYMVSFQPDGTEKTITATDLTNTDNKSVSIAYKYDVILLGIFGAYDFYRLDGNTFTLGPYVGPVPDGKLFDCYVINGERYEPGDTYEIDDVALVSIEFKDKPQDQSWIIPVVLVVSLLAIFALAAGAMYYRSKH